LFGRQSVYTHIPWASASTLLQFFALFYATAGLTKNLLPIDNRLDVGYGRFVHDPFAIFRAPDAGLHDGLLV
jgi:hypothetical protein